MVTIQNAQSLDYLDMQAYAGITKHNGGFEATGELLSLCHVEDAREALNVGCGIGVGSAYVARTHSRLPTCSICPSTRSRNTPETRP